MSKLPPICDQPYEEQHSYCNRADSARCHSRVAMCRVRRCIVSCEQRGHLICIWSIRTRRRWALFTRRLRPGCLRRCFILRPLGLSPCLLTQFPAPPFPFWFHRRGIELAVGRYQRLIQPRANLFAQFLRRIQKPYPARFLASVGPYHLSIAFELVSVSHRYREAHLLPTHRCKRLEAASLLTQIQQNTAIFWSKFGIK